MNMLTPWYEIPHFGSLARHAASATAADQKHNGGDEEEQPCKEREVYCVPHDCFAAVTLLVDAELYNLEKGDVEYEDCKSRGTCETAKAGTAALGNGRAEECEERKREGDEGNAECHDMQDENFR
jgi:hypothetical protein